MDRESFDRYQLETQFIEDLLGNVEDAERAILREINCPTNEMAIYAILNGETPAPWPENTAERSKQRARHAMHTLLLTAQTRRHLGLSNGNPRLAAYAALLAGLYANDAAAKAALAAHADRVVKENQRGGIMRGQQQRQKAERNDPTIDKYRRQWEFSDNLQAEFRSAAGVHSIETPLKRRTIERGLKRLRSQ